MKAEHVLLGAALGAVAGYGLLTYLTYAMSNFMAPPGTPKTFKWLTLDDLKKPGAMRGMVTVTALGAGLAAAKDLALPGTSLKG